MMREAVRTFLLALAAGALVFVAVALWRFLGWMPELVTALRVIARELTKLRELQDPSIAPRLRGDVVAEARRQAGQPYRWSGGR
jgi:hypothetical protein